MSRTATPKTAAEQLAAYRAAAKAIAPKKEESTLALTLGRALVSVPNFFEDVAAVYKCERAARQ